LLDGCGALHRHDSCTPRSVRRPDDASRQGGSAPVSGLGLWDAVSIIIGIVIGAGIYETAPLVFANVSSPAAGLLVWVAGGVLSLIGAACYAELASTYPRSGGDYVYLTKAFGPLSGFLFGWAQLTVILTGSIGMMAYVFADYASALFGLGASAGVILAGSSVLLLTLLNVGSSSLGTKAQNLLSVAKLLGVVGVVVTGVALALKRAPEAATSVPPAVTEAAPGVSLGLAMILVLYTFGGWNDAAFVAAEVRDRKRNLPRALLLGTAAITLIYVAMNAAFLFALGFEGARRSQAIARDLFVAAFGPAGGAAISLLVMVSALGAVNALIFTGSRLHATLGGDYSALSRLGAWHPRWRSPVTSLLVQMAITLAMIGLVGTARGRASIDGALVFAGLSPATWSGHGGFDTLLSCTAPVFWMFFLLTGLSVMRLRKLEPDRPRPFRVPLYPLTPLVFCGTCAYMLYSSIAYAGTLTLIGLAPLVLGVPVYLASKKRPAAGRVVPEPLASGAE
jgi:APA family basic amino acid/polyamine antiporter